MGYGRRSSGLLRKASWEVQPKSPLPSQIQTQQIRPDMLFVCTLTTLMMRQTFGRLDHRFDS